jgi:3-oxoacyl-[acyl-carrier protein] reductase
MNLDLNGRSCLITGAGSGIGRGIARVLAREGVRLALAGRDAEALETLRGELAQQGLGEATLCLGDLSTQDGVQQVAAQARQELGRVDMLVNNAGGSRPLNRSQVDDEDAWREAFELNFSAARRLAGMLTPDMVAAGWGRIVNVTGAVVAASINAATPAKAALQSWSKGLAAELAPRGITVNCVAPGRINSRQILETLHPTPESRQDYISRNIPIGRFGEPEEIANVVAFLLSPLCGYVTSAVIPVDGGLYRLAV